MNIEMNKDNDLEKNYSMMVKVIEELIKDETDLTANLSNVSAAINLYVKNINWVGFYLLKNNELVLGPFQGKPACVRIKVGKGVCGKAASERTTIIVPDVHKFEGHIACDSDSNSEIVIPIIKDQNLLGVLDIDSPTLNRFSDLEKFYFEETVKLIVKSYME